MAALRMCTLSIAVLTFLHISSAKIIRANLEEHGIDDRFLTTDLKTGLLRYVPDTSTLNETELVKYRDLVIYSKWSDKYCKISIPGGLMWSHTWAKQWCQKVDQQTGEVTDLCCQGHGHCHCPTLKRNCECR